MLTYQNLCCLDQELMDAGVKLIHETGHIQPLPLGSILKWEDKIFLVIRHTTGKVLEPVRLNRALKWAEKSNSGINVFFELQRLNLNGDLYYLSVYSTSPVTRITAVFDRKGAFLFSAPGDILAVEEDSGTYRLYFWNPTGSDFAVTEYDPKSRTFKPVIAVFDSGGTFAGAFTEPPSVPLINTNLQTEKPLQLFDHFSEFKKKKTVLPPFTSVRRLAEYQEYTLTGYRLEQAKSSEYKELLKYQPEAFFKGVSYSTGWAKNPEE